jgi:hypothetical protein
VNNTDRDRLELFAQVIGFGNVRQVRNASAKKKPLFRWDAGGRKRVKALQDLLGPYLGPRRQQQFAAALSNPNCR